LRQIRRISTTNQVGAQGAHLNEKRPVVVRGL
jgi:hypothetical protein